jgi:hypothetical protein
MASKRCQEDPRARARKQRQNEDYPLLKLLMTTKLSYQLPWSYCSS